MFNAEQFKELVITPTLDCLKAYSVDAVELLVFTMACESNGGTYLHQVNGPALGVYQMEPRTHGDIWQNYIYHRSWLAQLFGLHFDIVRVPSVERLIYDLRYATAMARVHYLRVSEALPDHKDVDAMYEYYKKYYNTPLGAATKAESIKKYNQFIGKKTRKKNKQTHATHTD